MPEAATMGPAAAKKGSGPEIVDHDAAEGDRDREHTEAGEQDRAHEPAAAKPCQL